LTPVQELDYCISPLEKDGRGPVITAEIVSRFDKKRQKETFMIRRKKELP
jgi:hypothetical protein